MQNHSTMSFQALEDAFKCWTLAISTLHKFQKEHLQNLCQAKCIKLSWHNGKNAVKEEYVQALFTAVACHWISDTIAKESNVRNLKCLCLPVNKGQGNALPGMTVRWTLSRGTLVHSILVAPDFKMCKYLFCIMWVSLLIQQTEGRGNALPGMMVQWTLSRETLVHPILAALDFGMCSNVECWQSQHCTNFKRNIYRISARQNASGYCTMGRMHWKKNMYRHYLLQ